MFPISRSLSTSRRRTDELGSLPKGHGYCPFQCPVEASCAVTFWRRLGPRHRKTSYCCYGNTHLVGLDNLVLICPSFERKPQEWPEVWKNRHMEVRILQVDRCKPISGPDAPKDAFLCEDHERELVKGPVQDAQIQDWS